MNGGRFDLSDTPDLLPVLSVLALKSDDPVEITGVGHARFKETDRIRVMAEGMAKMGAHVKERPDGLMISKPDRFARAVLDAHDDHRMFMAFSLASLLAPRRLGVLGVGSLDVSYPSFLDDMNKIGVRVAKA